MQLQRIAPVLRSVELLSASSGTKLFVAGSDEPNYLSVEFSGEEG